MRKIAIAAAAALLPATCAWASAPPAEIAALLKDNNCTVCHLISGRTVVGPSYADIAARYADDKAGAVAVLAERVKNGSDAKVWGAAPMPAAPKISEAEAEAVVKWILGL
ncbi:c-type cytochrome [Pseudothauera lacus]|uniref:Cytochrome C n=1 Tax=Pseudothauera lacus TaxID=2136175 RepID=A0A2T4IK46_9RHOO|nr:c-type cytochrome [Pseudothauera lacus]PTD98144.1 cytochrome C' [Pseudothauera lacus]